MNSVLLFHWTSNYFERIIAFHTYDLRINQFLLKDATMYSASTATSSATSPSSHAGSFRIESGRAQTLRPQHDALLRIQQGSVWATLPSQPGDHFLKAGQCLLVKAGDALVIEPWALRQVAGAQETVYLDWDPVPIKVAQAVKTTQTAKHMSYIGSSAPAYASSPAPIVTTFLIASYDLLTLTLANFFFKTGFLGGLRAFKALSSAKRAQGRMASCDSMASSGAL